MASIYRQETVDVGADKAWVALRRVGDAHQLFAPVLVAARMDADVRTVTFANGMVLRERILDVDDTRRRVAYTAMDAPGMAFHHASMQIVDDGPGRCRFVWITDFHPPEADANIAPLIEHGARALKANLEVR
jgi:hypothetical protein